MNMMLAVVSIQNDYVKAIVIVLIIWILRREMWQK